jgi:hypothetical protein
MEKVSSLEPAVRAALAMLRARWLRGGRPGVDDRDMLEALPVDITMAALGDAREALHTIGLDELLAAGRAAALELQTVGVSKGHTHSAKVMERLLRAMAAVEQGA